MFRPDSAHLIDPLMGFLRRFLADTASREVPGGNVLDACCGTGHQVHYYARRGLNATGIDLDPGMIRQRRHPADLPPGGKIRLEVADATALPFRDGHFDAASISFALHEKPAPVQDGVLREMRRVVRPGGLLLFADYGVPLPRNWAGQLIRLAEWLAGGEHHRCSLRYCADGGLNVILNRNGVPPRP